MRCLRLIISLWIVGFTEQVVDADAVKAGELDENLRRNIVRSNFILGIAGLRHAQIIGHLLLFQIMIGSQITNALIHHLSSPEDSISNLK